MTNPADLPELLFSGFSDGQRFSDTFLTLNPSTVRRYGEAVHNDALIALGDAAEGTPIPDPSILVIAGITRRVLGKDGRCPPGGVLARQDFIAHRLPRVGETLRTRTSIEKTYEKRGRNYVQLRCDIENSDDGTPIGRVDSHVIWAR